MVPLRLNLFGGFAAYAGASNDQFVLPRRKAAALLAVLASSAGRERSREELADLLWGRMGEQGALNNLRQSLFAIRHMLPDVDGLVATSTTLLLDPMRVQIDAREFELKSAEGTLPALERAAELYVGDFLQGFSLREEPFEQWRAREKQRLQDICLSVFERLMDKYIAVERYRNAVQIADRSLAVDPLHEVAQQTLIRADIAAGRNGLARRRYDEFSDLLAKELGVNPSAETQSILPSVSGLRRNTLAHRDNAIATPTINVGFASSPIVAVLPFDNMGMNSQSFADTLTPKLIAVLASALPLKIVDHHSISAATAKNTPTSELAISFGASYAIEGSVRLWNNCWRADFSLVDVLTGRHLFPDSCEVAGAGLFQSADQIAYQIAAKVSFQIEVAERGKAPTKATISPSAWYNYNRGMALLDLLSHTDILPAQRCFLDALEIEPNNARILAGYSQAVLQEGICLVGRSREETFSEGLELAHRAYALNRNDPFVNWTLGKAYQRAERLDLAMEALQRALKVVPNNPEIGATMGNLLGFMGMPEKGIPILATSLSSTDVYAVNIARSHLQTGNYLVARDWCERVIQLQPYNSWAYLLLGSARGHLGQTDKGYAALLDCEKTHPGRVEAEFSIKPTQYADPREHDHILDGLQKVGWQP